MHQAGYMRCIGNVLLSLLSLSVLLSVPLIVPLFCLLLSDIFLSFFRSAFDLIFYENGMTSHFLSMCFIHEELIRFP